MIRGLVRWLLLLLAAAGLLVTAIPAWPTGLWWVRYLDYPRLEFLPALLILLVLSVASRWVPGLWDRRWPMLWGTAAALGIAIAWDATLLSPYLAPAIVAWPEPQVAAGACPAESRLRVLEANVQMTNQHDDRLLAMVREADPDIAWFQETDAWWETELSPLAASLPHGMAQAQPNYFGVHLFSKLPLQDPHLHLLTGSRNPSVFAGVTLASGAAVKLYAVHPRPPQVGQSTAERDGQLMAAALAARDDTVPHLLLGDLNSVPWEGIIARLLRIGQLRDPRIGRGLYITWNAKDVLAKWPLDHILTGPGLSLVALRVLPAFGSDHRPLLADLCVLPVADGGWGSPLQPGDLAAARVMVQRGQGKAISAGAAKPPGSDTPQETDRTHMDR